VRADQKPRDALGIARLLAAAADGEVVEVDAPAARLGDLEERQIGLAVQERLDGLDRHVDIEVLDPAGDPGGVAVFENGAGVVEEPVQEFGSVGMHPASRFR
jgi:hypothetical protein